MALAQQLDGFAKFDLFPCASCAMTFSVQTLDSAATQTEIEFVLGPHDQLPSILDYQSEEYFHIGLDYRVSFYLSGSDGRPSIGSSFTR